MPLPFLGLLAGGLGRGLLGGAVRGGLSGSMRMASQAGGSGGGGLLQNLMASGGGGEAPESQGLTGTSKRDFFALGKEMTNKFEGSDKQRQDQREANTKGPKPMMKMLGQMAGKAKGIAGLNLSMAAFARSSTLFQSSMGAFNQVMSAYADMFFAPFAPYVFKFISFLAGGIEGFGKIWEIFVKLSIGAFKLFSFFTMPFLIPMKLAFKYISENWDMISGAISKPFKLLGAWLTEQTWWAPLNTFISDPMDFIINLIRDTDWSGLWKSFTQSDFVLKLLTGVGNILNGIGKIPGVGKGISGEGILQFVAKQKQIVETQKTIGDIMEKLPSLTEQQAKHMLSPSKGIEYTTGEDMSMMFPGMMGFISDVDVHGAGVFEKVLKVPLQEKVVNAFEGVGQAIKNAITPSTGFNPANYNPSSEDITERSRGLNDFHNRAHNHSENVSNNAVSNVLDAAEIITKDVAGGKVQQAIAATRTWADTLSEFNLFGQ